MKVKLWKGLNKWDNRYAIDLYNDDNPLTYFNTRAELNNFILKWNLIACKDKQIEIIDLTYEG